MLNPEEKELEQFIAEYTMARDNAVFFLENYWKNSIPTAPSYYPAMTSNCSTTNSVWFRS